MRIDKQIIVFDTADLGASSSFWAALLGGSASPDDDDWHTVYVDGQPRMGFQLAPDHVAPDWPGNTVPQQIHLDLYVDDVRAAHDETIALGAKLIQPADDLDADSGFQVYTDPAGHPFCLCWG
jgi:predicted enzyme related to lactoylglutathione lyase